MMKLVVATNVRGGMYQGSGANSEVDDVEFIFAKALRSP